LHASDAVTIQVQSASTTRAARPVHVALGSTTTLAGDLAVPDRAHGLVLFPHGSIISRSAPAAQFLADALHQHGLATLMIDLLTEREEEIDERTGKLRFDMALLANRIISVAAWAQDELYEPTRHALRTGLFGTHTAAGAALVAVTQQPGGFQTVASYSGRADLAGSALGRILIPTLFIVGSTDEQGRSLTRHAIERMHNDARLELVATPSGALEAPPALDQVARLSAEWFAQRLG
jgi:putative phosphoribosyl transferase